MKKLIILALLLSSCVQQKYKRINTEIIEGKISAVESGHSGRISTLPKIYVQSSKITKEVEIPFKYENRWHIGDSCLLIIEKYEKID